MKYLCFIMFLFTVLYAEDVSTIIEDRKKVLRYGMDSEVISLIDQLTLEKDTELLEEITEEYRKSSNIKLKQLILSYFVNVERDALGDQVLLALADQAADESFVLALLNYVRSFKLTAASVHLDYYVEDNRPIVAAAAIKTVGELELAEKLPLLHDIFNEGDTDDAVQSEILLAFGKLKDKEILPLLIDILENTEEDRSNRWYACAALGEIGGDEAFNAVKQAFNDTDTILRTYALGAVSKFDNPEVEQIIIEEGLRDSFWRVRLSAIEEIEKKKFVSAIDALTYRAENDPEQKIRERAIQALGVIGGTSSNEFLSSVMLDEKKNPTIRLEAAKALIKSSDSSTEENLKELVKNEWDKKGSRLIEFVAKELSVTSSPGLESVFKQLLSHEDISIRIYAIRGIGLNNIVSMKPQLEQLDTEGSHPLIRKAAVTALEQM